ncbi:eukaryotic translation initiation factor 4 gamma-like [Lathyrus oleraceus]|uniref:eukaryotic translation initiation factor 4 gamma-like n=1 Tax=Pisum sativum TaxID=3888 RepID=UPI0021D00BC0|nr:eukaryotic translation initiation factor 4 gamma-like [Pisum sativum]
MKKNGADLTEELRMQGWETYFQRLYGPVYTNLLQARSLSSQQPSHSEPEPKVTSPPLEHPNPTTSEQTQTPPPTQQPNPPPEQPINFEPQPTHSPSEPTHSPFEPHPQPEQTTQSPSAISTLINFAASITHTLNLSAPNSPSPSSPASDIEPETTLPTLEEAMQVFAESSMEKIKSLTINSGFSDVPSAVMIHWNRVISWMTYEAFKLKGLSEQVCNDFIRDAGIRLQERLAREAEERARKEAEEKARQEEEQRIIEAEDNAAAADVEAKAKAEAEEAARITAEEVAKAKADAPTQGEHSNSGFVPLVLKTLEELQKEQQVVRARLDQ